MFPYIYKEIHVNYGDKDTYYHKEIESGGVILNKKGNKVVIIGTGFVGSTTAFALMQSGLISDMILIDVNKEKALGEVMDLNHGLSFTKPLTIEVGDYSQCENADVIIIAAGPSMLPGESRLTLAEKNCAITRNIMKEVAKYTEEAVIIIATNPVDILTYVGAKAVGYDEKKIIGSGTVLDSARFRFLLSRYFNIDTRNVHGYIIGEHGDTEVAAWSLTNIVGMDLREYCPLCDEEFCDEKKSDIFRSVRDSGYEILGKKGATYYGVAMAVKRITEAVLRDENTILTVSSVMNGQYGIDEVAFSLPTIINRDGIRQVLELPIDEREKELLLESADKLKEILKRIE